MVRSGVLGLVQSRRSWPCEFRLGETGRGVSRQSTIFVLRENEMKKSVRFSKDTKQRIIDEYLASTGLNTFRADEFVDWLANQLTMKPMRLSMG